jgi:hypothetical protein
VAAEGVVEGRAEEAGAGECDGTTGKGRATMGKALALRRLILASALLSLSNAEAFAAQSFDTPEQAVTALVSALRSGAPERLLKVLGPEGEKLVHSGDPVADRQARARFLAAFGQAHELVPQGDDRVILVVGESQWPFPIPAAKRGERWRFDTLAGEREILDRRIGTNELDAIEVCRAYVDAQREYALTDRNGDGFLEYAQSFMSSPGKHDGLYWPTADDEPESPIGPLMARARAEGYSTDQGRPQPYHGYYYRILKAQGPHAPGGVEDYVVRGHMIGGFALVAYPAQYSSSGIMTFIVNHDGVVFQKDLGPETAEKAKAMDRYDPDPSWKEP